MKYFIIIVLVLSQSVLFAQGDLNKLLQRKSELERSISFYQQELKKVDSKIQKLKQDQALANVTVVTESGQKIIATVNANTSLRLSPNVNATEIIAVPKDATIYVHHEHNGLYFKATYYGKEGWINYTKISSHPEIDAMIEAPKSSTSETKVLTVDKSDPKYIRLKKIYGEEKAIKMMNKILWKGMSHGQVRETLGKTISQTKNNTPKGLEEEWVYTNQKLIFLNGSLVSW